MSSILQLAVSELGYLFLTVHSPLHPLSPDGSAHLGRGGIGPALHSPTSSPSRRISVAESTYRAPGLSTNVTSHSKLPKTDGGQGCFQFILWLLFSQMFPALYFFWLRLPPCLFYLQFMKQTLVIQAVWGQYNFSSLWSGKIISLGKHKYGPESMYGDHTSMWDSFSALKQKTIQ
jgi:hypothetical protein